LRLNDLLTLYDKTRDLKVLQLIYKKHGKYGVHMAAKVSGVKRSELKAKLNMNDPKREITREAWRECGYKHSQNPILLTSHRKV